MVVAFVYKIHLGNQIDRAGSTLFTDPHEIIYPFLDREVKDHALSSGTSPHRPYNEAPPPLPPWPLCYEKFTWTSVYKQLPRPPLISRFLFTFRYIPDLNAFIKRSRNNQSCFKVKAATKSIVLMTQEDFNTRLNG